jgi:hypothetical protein
MVKNEPIGKPARNKWIKATEDPSLSPGKRIRLFCEISRQADKIIEEDKNGNAEAEIREEIVKLCKSTKSGGKPNTRFHEIEINRFLWLCNFSDDEVDDLMTDADCPPIKPTDNQSTKPGYKSRMSISHALLLATVTKGAKRKKLLSEAIVNHWSIDVLTEKLRNDREGSIVRPVKTTGEKLVRHRTTVKTLTETTAKLLKLLDELEDPIFCRTIIQSREDRADTVKLLNELDSTFEMIRKTLPAAKKAAKAAAKKLNKVVVKKL